MKAKWKADLMAVAEQVVIPNIWDRNDITVVSTKQTRQQHSKLVKVKYKKVLEDHIFDHL